MVISTVSVPLAEAGHIVAVVIVAGDPISTSLAIACHYSVAVVVPCNSICSTLAKSSAHISFLLVFERFACLLLHLKSISSSTFQGGISNILPEISVWRCPECLQPLSVAVTELYAPATGRCNIQFSYSVINVRFPKTELL